MYVAEMHISFAASPDGPGDEMELESPEVRLFQASFVSEIIGPESPETRHDSSPLVSLRCVGDDVTLVLHVEPSLPLPYRGPRRLGGEGSLQGTTENSWLGSRATGAADLVAVGSLPRRASGWALPLEIFPGNGR